MEPGKLTTYQAGIDQANMNRKLQKICDDILRPYGITKMQWLIIGAILDHDEEGVRLSELAEELGTSMPYLTAAVNQLEAREILQRQSNEKDVRSKLITVADDYKATCHEIEKTLRNGLRKTIYAKVDPQEFRIYLKVMSELSSFEIQ